MKILRLVVLTLALLVLSALAWVALAPPRAPATWLRVEAPPAVIVGQSVPVRIHLDTPPAATRLGVDLHWATARRKPRGFLSHSPAQRVDARRSTYTFELSAPSRDEIGHVYAVIFLSPSGDWEDRSAVATSALIPVRIAGAREPVGPIPVYDSARDAAPVAAPVPAGRRAIAGLWLLSGLHFWRRHRRGSQRGRERTGPRQSRSVGLAVACLAAGVWELSNAESSLVHAARSAALESLFYFERSGPQRAAALALLAIAAGLIVWTLRRSPVHATDFAQAGLWLYAGLSLVSLLSLHQTDRLLASTLVSFPVAQVVKFAIAVAIFACALAVSRRETRAGHGAPGGPSRAKA